MVRVGIVDLLAAIRLPVESDVLIIGLADGSSCPLCISEELRTQRSCVEVGAYLRLRLPGRPTTAADVIVSIRAVTFDEFVGGR